MGSQFKSVKIRLVLLGILVVTSLLHCEHVFAQQLEFYTTPPIIDSFPIVRIGIVLSSGDQPASPLTPANFTVTEDGANVTPLQLLNCSGSSAAAVVFVSDVSQSIGSSAGTSPYDAYVNGYSQLLAQLPPPSVFADVEFTDSVTEYLPGALRPSHFYLAQNQTDTTAFLDSVRAFQYGGNTDIDTAIVAAAALVQQSALPKKVIVLITDDAVNNDPHIYAILHAANISFFVMELRKDTVWQNFDLTNALDGKYFAAGDTNQFAADMTAIGQGIFGESCLLRYVSTLPCPWEKSHTVRVKASFAGSSATVPLEYSLGHNSIDTVPPIVTVTDPVYTSRKVTGSAFFPCDPGLKNFTDSGLVNFAKLRQPRNFPDTVSDSLVVIDSMLPASGYYFAEDSLGHIRKVKLVYTPQPDTLPPQLPLPVLISGSYRQDITEQRPWDRGLQSVQLLPGAKNLMLDSVHYFGPRFAQAYVHIPIPKDSASGCLEAIDSVGNHNTYCYVWSGQGGDTLPPLFLQSPLAEPRKSLSGQITEMRAGDVGIASVVLTPVTNTSLPVINYVSKSLATVAATLNDSLYPALCAVEAADSAGNPLRDTLRYQPLPDKNPPQVTVTNPLAAQYLVSATEVQPWDRGIMILSTFGALTNIVSALPVFTDARHASVLLTVTDPTKAASATIVAQDSAGNAVMQPIAFTPGAQPGLMPLQAAMPLDFGTISAGPTSTLPLSVANPNAVPVTLKTVALSGDDSEFSLVETMPLTVGANSTATLHFTFSPNLIGHWNSGFAMSNDTMQLLQVTTIGNSTGTLHITLDTLQVAKGGDNGTMKLRFDAIPKPINLDTIEFTLSSNQDIALLSALNQNCSLPDTGICNYNVTSTKDGNGNYHYLFVRSTKGLSPFMQASGDSIVIPVSTFVGSSISTPVMISETSAGAYCTVTTDTGLVTMGNICADPTLRAGLNNQLAVYLQSVTPNPAGSELHATIVSHIASQSVTYELQDVLGQCATRGTLNVAKGISTCSVDLKAVRSGSYVFRILMGESVCGIANIIVAK
jgi:hypothetical protein